MSKSEYTIKVPIHINTNFRPYCSNCEKADLEIVTNTAYANGDEYAMSYILHCKNRGFCAGLFKNLQRLQAEWDKKDDNTQSRFACAKKHIFCEHADCNQECSLIDEVCDK